MSAILSLFGNFSNLDWKMVVMWIIGAVLIYLAIKKDMEPALQWDLVCLVYLSQSAL